MIYVNFCENIFQDKSIHMVFHIFKFNNLKVIHDLYSQCLTQALSKTTLFFSMEGVPILNSNNIGVIDFSIPPTCPQNNSLCLAVSEEAGLDHEKETNTKEASSPSSRKRNGKRSTALVETEVRRGPRMRDSAKGFKLSGCTNKKCLACGTTPPHP